MDAGTHRISLFRRRGECFDEVVKKGLPFVKRSDGNAFVPAVEADVVAVNENALNAVARNAGGAKHAAVRGTHDHVWDNRNAGPHFGSDARCSVEYVGPHG